MLRPCPTICTPRRPLPELTAALAIFLALGKYEAHYDGKHGVATCIFTRLASRAGRLAVSFRAVEV